MSEDIREKVREMAKLAVLSNRISEIQEKNLGLYPFVFFESVSKSAIDYDLSNAMDADIKEDRTNLEVTYKINKPELKHMMVSYKLTLDESKNDHLENRFKAIETAVRELFWGQIKVSVYFNDVLKFESK